MTEPAPDKPSAGALLKAARERQGLHIAALAAAIKVAPRKLDALENDRWDELPDATFTRALAQSVCRTLKIDPRPVLDLLPQPGSMALESGLGGLNTPFQGRPGRDEPGLGGAAIRPMVLAAGALMIAALVVYFLPPGLWSSSEPAPVAASVPLSAAVATVAEPAASAASAAATEPPPAQAAASAAQPAGETVFSAPPAEETAAATAAGLVQLRTTEASWIDARDASGQVLLSRTVLPGESVGLDGTLPIRLVIGNAAATQLGFRGRPVDLAPRTRDNVARVELP
ncbi:MAG: helix-turn-helix domain-containing protein [Rubrivivax sp.]|nr:helix-turn-helix domain-containing protein [Rubrivivax sp.]